LKISDDKHLSSCGANPGDPSDFLIQYFIQSIRDSSRGHKLSGKSTIKTIRLLFSENLPGKGSYPRNKVIQKKTTRIEAIFDSAGLEYPINGFKKTERMGGKAIGCH